MQRHGGSDDAAKGLKGTREKDMNLRAALLLKEEAERRGINVIMTRNSDKFVSLTERVAMQKEGKAFISINHNSKKTRSKKRDDHVFSGMEIVRAEHEATGRSRILAEDVLRSLLNWAISATLTILIL